MDENKSMLTERMMLRIPARDGKEILIENIDDNRKVRLTIGKSEAICETEDLATILSMILPPDRAAEYFAEVQAETVSKGKAFIQLTATKNIMKGEPIIATLDITKYMNNQGLTTGLRMTKSGILY